MATDAAETVLDKYRVEIQLSFAVLATSKTEAEYRLGHIRTWMEKAGDFLRRRGWIADPDVTVGIPTRQR